MIFGNVVFHDFSFEPDEYGNYKTIRAVVYSSGKLFCAELWRNIIMSHPRNKHTSEEEDSEAEVITYGNAGKRERSASLKSRR